MDGIEVVPGVRIPSEEVHVSFTRSGGPGGQHANTSATKVQLRFDVEATSALDEAQKARVRDLLGHRMTAEGELLLEAGEHRSQTRNRDVAIARFRALLSEALRPRRSRRPTSRPRRAEERRLEAKRRRSERKRFRRPPDW